MNGHATKLRYVNKYQYFGYKMGIFRVFGLKFGCLIQYNATNYI